MGSWSENPRRWDQLQSPYFFLTSYVTRSILAQELAENKLLNVSVDTPVTVNGVVPGRPDCQQKSFGWEGTEFFDDYWRSIEKQRRSTSTCIILCTSSARVTCSRTNEFWWRRSTRRRLRRHAKSRWLINSKPEDQRISRLDYEKSHVEKSA